MSIVIMVLSILFSTGTPAYPIDQIKLDTRFRHDDPSYSYAYALLVKALETTIESDGLFIISHGATNMKRNRILSELEDGNTVNVHIAATRQEWEISTLPVRIPVIKGLLGYRLFLIRKDKIPEFKKIKNISDLMALRAGLGQQWTTTAVLNLANFNVVTGSEYEGLFGMLDHDRFDYFPRGVNEIFIELADREKEYPELCVEPTLALYFPTPSYFFVSPKYPHLAERIRKGLEIMIKTGVYNAMFEDEFGIFIDQARFEHRNILTIENPLLSRETPFDRTELWFTP